MKSIIIKEYCEPILNVVMSVLNDYFEPTFFLTPLDFWGYHLILYIVGQTTKPALSIYWE